MISTNCSPDEFLSMMFDICKLEDGKACVSLFLDVSPQLDCSLECYMNFTLEKPCPLAKLNFRDSFSIATSYGESIMFRMIYLVTNVGCIGTSLRCSQKRGQWV